MTKGEADDITEQSNFARKGISSEVSELVGSLRAIKTPKSLKGIVERFNAISTVTDVCKTLYGWGVGGGTTTISISNLTAPAQWSEPKAIDVASAPVNAPDATPAGQEHTQDLPGAVTER